MKQGNPPNYYWVHLVLAVWSRLSVYLMRVLWRKIFFFDKWLLIGDSFWVKDVVCVCFLSQHWDPIRPVRCLWVHVCLGPAVFRRPCFLTVLYPLWLLQFPRLLFCRGPWTVKGGHWMETSYSGLSVPSFLVLLLSSCESLLISVHCRRKLFWWWLSKTSVYECSRMPLGVFLLLP